MICFSNFRIYFREVDLTIDRNIEIQRKVAQNDGLNLGSSNLMFKDDNRLKIKSYVRKIELISESVMEIAKTPRNRNF